MKTRKEDLQRLKRVTEAVWLSASQVLRARAEAERAAAAKLAGLAADRHRSLKILSGETSDAAQILAASRWMRWSEAERSRLNIDLARRRAELAQEQEKAKAAFARDQALEKILRQIGKTPAP